MQGNLKIHHVGIKVKDLDKSMAIYERLGYRAVSDKITDTIQCNRIVFMESGDESQVLELIEPVGKDSSIYGFPDGYHHICFEADDPDFAERFRELKIGRIFTKPVIVPAIGNRKALFGCLNNGTFAEFLL